MPASRLAPPPAARWLLLLALSGLLHGLLTWQLLELRLAREQRERVPPLDVVLDVTEPPAPPPVAPPKPVTPPKPLVPPKLVVPPRPAPPIPLTPPVPVVVPSPTPPVVVSAPVTPAPAAPPPPGGTVERQPQVDVIAPGGGPRGLDVTATDRAGAVGAGRGGGPATATGPGESVAVARPGPPAPGPVITQTARPRGGYQVSPAYPAAARQARAEGTTLLRVHVEVDGRVGEVSVQRSAGHADLDEAAARAVARWRFEPARSGADPVAVWVLIPVVFRLTDQ